LWTPCQLHLSLSLGNPQPLLKLASTSPKHNCTPPTIWYIQLAPPWDDDLDVVCLKVSTWYHSKDLHPFPIPQNLQARQDLR
jgi:hypothetical protein